MNKDKLLQQLRKELDNLAPDTHFKRGYAHAIIDVDHFRDEPTPALDWKPINITQMQPDKDYLVWGHKWSAPDVAYLTGAGYFISERTEVYDDERVTYREAELTHYAEFNKPEGME
jgi:hypothetical protein